MTEIVPASDPRVRVTLTFHPEGKAPLVVDIPRQDFLPETSVRAIKASLRELQAEARQTDKAMRRKLRDFQIELKRYDKAFRAWERRLDDDSVEDPGPAPEEPERPEFEPVMDEREAERATALLMLKHVVTASEYRQLEKCVTAELVQAKAAWDEASAVPLGELLASPTSSTVSTEGPSEPTSSEPGGADQTSDADSIGETSEIS